MYVICMNKEKKKTEKKPLSKAHFQDLIQVALNHKNTDALKVILLMRYTGMHVSVLAEPIKMNLHVEVEPEGNYIVWERPKKEGKTAYTSIKQSRHINFKVQKFIEELKKRRHTSDNDPNSNGKPYKITRTYFYLLVRDVGEKAGLKKISPLTLRHTFGVQTIPLLGSEMTREKMNCSDGVFKTYSKHDRETEKEVYERANW